MSHARQKDLGAYYTPTSAADHMADWLVRTGGERVLEPSFGEGIFLKAVADAAARHKMDAVTVCGFEINEEAVQHARQVPFGALADDLRNEDFLSAAPFGVDAVIGNPPYVRLRNLPPDQKERALETAARVLGEDMRTSGSVWMPFVLHAMRFLNMTGRMAVVLPHELTYVKYARPLWRALGQHFGSLRVARTHERLFPDLLQDVVILFADHFGAQTDHVTYRPYGDMDDLLEGRPVAEEALSIEAIAQGERVFTRALLSDELRQLLSGKVAAATRPAREVVTFNIGYVTGNKSFFHPDEDVADDFDLPERSLRPAVASTRMLRETGVRSSALQAPGTLFLPDPDALTAGERRYIEQGEADGVNEAYKCRVRDPWFVVPNVRVPDVLVSVFSESPVLLVNDAGHVATNSLLCGYIQEGQTTASALAASWYTTLMRLQFELEVHALGGGVMVMVPGEAGRLRLPCDVTAPDDHLAQIDRLMQDGDLDAAYAQGDDLILRDQLGFDRAELSLIKEGIDTLAHWRTSARAS